MFCVDPCYFIQAVIFDYRSTCVWLIAACHMVNFHASFTWFWCEFWILIWLLFWYDLAAISDSTQLISDPPHWLSTQLVSISTQLISGYPRNSFLDLYNTHLWLSTQLVSGSPHGLSLAHHMAYLWLNTWFICDSTHSWSLTTIQWVSGSPNCSALTFHRMSRLSTHLVSGCPHNSFLTHHTAHFLLTTYKIYL